MLVFVDRCLLSVFSAVEVYSDGTFRLQAVIQTHHKLVNVILWHPYVTMACPNAALYKYYIAIASNEAHITVVDLSSLFGRLCYLHKSFSYFLSLHSHEITLTVDSVHSLFIHFCVYFLSPSGVKQYG